MTLGKRLQIAEKMAGEITLSDSPGVSLKRWRLNFEISVSLLSKRLSISPSVISDYESGRRKSPGTAIVGRIVDTLITLDEERGGKNIQKYASLLSRGLDNDVIYDIHEYKTSIPLGNFSEAIEASLLCGSLDQQIFGYTLINSLSAILQCSSDEFSRIYGWCTERALVFTHISTGKSPMVAIRVTPFKPRCVVLQGIRSEEIHPLVMKMAERDRITLLCTEMDCEKISTIMRSKEW